MRNCKECVSKTYIFHPDYLASITSAYKVTGISILRQFSLMQ